jgi:hypothetical protein
MNHFFRAFTSLFLISILCFQTASACSVVVISLRKEFRNAKDVFLGEIVSVRKDKSYQVTFKVLKSWKGRNEKELTIEAFDHCPCPNRSFDFVVGKEFLVMTTLEGEGKNLTFAPCQIYAYQVDKQPDEAKKTMKRLDDFWFRAWAQIYPF